MLILTEAERVAINFGTPDQIDLAHLSLAEAAKLCEDGQFGNCSMLPKVETCMKFVRANLSKRAITTSLDKTKEALADEMGTVFSYQGQTHHYHPGARIRSVPCLRKALVR